MYRFGVCLNQWPTISYKLMIDDCLLLYIDKLRAFDKILKTKCLYSLFKVDFARRRKLRKKRPRSRRVSSGLGLGTPRQTCLRTTDIL